jgi:hypothetical protein
MDPTEDDLYFDLIVSSESAKMDPNPQDLEDQKSRITINPERPPRAPRPMKFILRLSSLLRDLHSQGAISLAGGHYSCTLCHVSFTTLTEIARHCWQRHQTCIPPSLRPAVLFLCPDLPLDFSADDFGPLGLLESRLTKDDFAQKKAEVRMNLFDFGFILAVLGPQFLDGWSENSVVEGTILLNLPQAFPVVVRAAGRDAVLEFSDTRTKTAEETKRLFLEAAARITNEMLTVAKFTDVSPDAVGESVIQKIRGRLSVIVLKSRFSFDPSMSSCDVTLTVLCPRWGAQNGKVLTKLRKIAKKGEILLCQKCVRFFNPGSKCADDQPHRPFSSHWTKLFTYTRPFFEPVKIEPDEVQNEFT